MSSEIVVHLGKAADLKAGDFGGKSDPFVELFWEGDSEGKKPLASSGVVKDSLNPVWASALRVPFDAAVHRVLLVDVWDKDLAGRDFLGRARVEVDMMTRRETPYHLTDKDGKGGKSGTKSAHGVKGMIFLSFELPEAYLQARGGVSGLLANPNRALGQGKAQLNQLEGRLAKSPTLRMISEKTGVSLQHMLIAVLSFTALFVLFGFGYRAMSNLVGAVYPLYVSFKAVKSTCKEDDTQWLTYWVVYGFFSVLEAFADVLLFWLPFYYLGKMIFLIWAQHPDSRGAQVIFRTLILPVLNRYEGHIDGHLDNLRERVSGGRSADPAKTS